MNRLKAVLQSKSANAPPQRGAHKKSWSSGEVPRLASKKRGVYVEHKNPNSKPKGAADKQQPPVVKRPPKNQKEFLNSVLNILSQETAGTQFPEQSAQGPANVSHKRLRVRKRIPVNTADTGTQDLDAMYSDITPPAVEQKTARKKRFRSRALNSNFNESLKLDEPEPVTVLKEISNPIQHTSSRSITITEAVRDGQKIIDSKLNQGQATPAEAPAAAAQPVNEDIPTELGKPSEAPPAENPPGEKPKRSKVRILEPLKKYEDDDRDKPERSERKSNNQFEGPVSATEVDSAQRRNAYALNSGFSRNSIDDYESYVRETRAVRSRSRTGSKQRYVYQTVPVIDVDDYGGEYDVNDLDNVEVYTAVTTRMPNRPTVGFTRPYEDYARVCNMRSKSFNHAARKQFEARQSKPTARTRVYTNQDKNKATRYKNKGKDHPLLELLKKELTLDPDWFVEPDNMHDALLKVMDGRRRARESIQFQEGSVGYYRDLDHSECMLRGKQRIIPASRQVYKPKAVGYAKRSLPHYDGYKQSRRRYDDSVSVIRADISPEEQEFNILYHPLDAPPSLTVQNYDYYREDTPLQRIYLSRKPEDIDSISSKEILPRSVEQPQYLNTDFGDPLEDPMISSTLTSDTTLRLLMSPQALDYNMDKSND